MRTNLNRESVFAECDQLLTAGVTPTLRVLQERLGGSYTTLRPFLQSWKDARRSDSAHASPVPQALLDRGHDLVRLLYADVTKSYTSQAEQLRTACAAEIDAMRRDLAEATQEVARLEGEVASRTLRAEGLEREVAETRAQLLSAVDQRRSEADRAVAAETEAQRLRERLEDVERRAAALEARQDAAASLQARFDQIEAGLRALRPTEG